MRMEPFSAFKAAQALSALLVSVSVVDGEIQGSSGGQSGRHAAVSVLLAWPVSMCL